MIFRTLLCGVLSCAYAASLAYAADAVDARLTAADQRLANDAWEAVWQANESGPRATFTADTTMVHSAPSSLCLLVPEGAGAANSRMTVFAANDGLQAGDLHISGVYRFKAGTQGIPIVSVFGYDAGWKRLPDHAILTVDATKPRDQWTTFTGAATLPAGLNAVVIQVAIVEGSGTFWLDDLTVVKAPLAANP